MASTCHSPSSAPAHPHHAHGPGEVCCDGARGSPSVGCCAGERGSASSGCAAAGQDRSDRPRLAAPWPPSAAWGDGSAWLRAASNTVHCLVGCAIGDIAAMTLVPLWWPAVPFAALMAIAVLAGIVSSLGLETLVLRRREGMAWGRALGTAWGMSLISMVAMEVAMNAVDWLVMGGQRMPVTHAGYWLAWLPALAAGFLAPLPYNYLALKRHGHGCH
jgi:hypothetical protein